MIRLAMGTRKASGPDSFAGTTFRHDRGPSVDDMPWCTSYADVEQVFRSKDWLQGGGARDSHEFIGDGLYGLSATDHFQHGCALVRIKGRRSADRRARLCPADLHDGVAPDGAVFRSPVDAVAADVMPDDLEGRCHTSLIAKLRRASTCSTRCCKPGELFGIGVRGFVALGI
jgi:hypothetical protein